MPNASKYIIDVANIRPGGKPIKGLYVGSSEKKYATLGNKCIYDKVLYELSINNITNVEPNAQTVTISSYTSKRTHGNGAVDTLYINPSTKQVTANTSTANTKDTTVVVNQALTLNGTTTGTGVTVTITQMKDYPIGLTLTISPKSAIPASGGSISSALTNYTYSVKANYKSGNNNVDVTSNAATTITANVTGVTASSKGTTASNATTAGTIRFTASYTCNGKTVTTTTDVNITQDKNEVVSYANPTFTLTPSSNQTLPASGGRVTASVSNVQQVRTWSSNSTDTFSPSYTTTWNAQTISCDSRGTVTGDALTLGTTTATVTANGKSTTKSYVVYQQANVVTNYDYSASNYDYWASCSIGDGLTAAGGSASVSASAGHTHKYYYLYTSQSTSGPYYTYPGDTVTTAMIGNGNSRFSYSNGTISHSSMGTNATTDTVTIRATNAASTSATGDASKSIENKITDYNYSPYSYSASVSIGSGISAAGGSATVSASAGHYSYYYYTSKVHDSGGHWHTDGVSTSMTENGNNRFTYNANTLTLSHSSMGTNVTTDYVTIKATNTTNTSATASTRQGWSNAVTNYDYNASNYDYWASCSIGDGLTAAGGSASVSASAGHTHKYYYYYTSQSTSDPYYSYPSDGVSTSMIGNGNSRFSYSNGTITHSSMGDNVTTDTVTIRATNNANTSATGDASKSISNYVTTTWGDITVTVPSNQSVTSASGSITLTSSNTSASQIRSDKYTSGTQKSTAISYTPDSSWNVSSNNTGFTTGHTIVSGGFVPRIRWDENTSTSERSATITVSYTANGKTGSNSFTITQSGQSFKFTIKNNSNTYGLYGSFGSITPTGQMVSGDFPPGTNRTVDMTSGTVIINNYNGAVQGKTSGTVKFECSGAGAGTMSGNIQSNGSINITGSLTVKNGTTVTITIS